MSDADPRPEAPLDRVFSEARAFVAAHGDPRSRALAAALCGLGPPLALADAVACELAEDGGLPAGDRDGAPVGDPDARLAATTAALRGIDHLGMLAHPVVDRLAGFLVAAQREDGSFGSAGEPDARVAPSAAAGAALARVPSVRLSVLQAAEAFCMGHWDVEQVQGGGPQARARILATFELLAAMPSELSDEALQWCGRELERGFRSGVFTALEAARVFVRCGADALPGTRLSAKDVLPRLLESQNPDGSFGDPDACVEARVHDTLDALVALSRLATD